MTEFQSDLVLSFAVGGLWVTMASLVAQRFGGKTGGFIAGLPATSVLAIFFITHSEGARHGYDLTTVFPLTISINGLFLLAFAAFSGKRFLTGMAAALLVWALAEGVLFYARPDRIVVSLAAGVLIFLVSVWLSGRIPMEEPETRHLKTRLRDILIRALAGGGIVVAAMLGSHFGGPLAGGILSAFPATAAATLAITAAYTGRELPRTMARPMMISGVINCMVFALAFRHVVLRMHVLPALGLAYGVTVASAAATFYVMNKSVKG